MSAPNPLGADRLVALDVFRGLTIGGMVMVNNPGTWSAVYPQLEHAEWHGWTFTDTIFPFFLFIVGVAIPMALGKRAADAGPALYGKIARRTAVLFGLGLWLAIFPFYNGVTQAWVNVGELRIMGVLQRIALCYLACSLIFLWLRSWRAQIAATAGLLVFYWIAMTLGGDLTAEGNLSGAIDRLILTPAHIWKGSGQVYDPEGLFSTLPSIATTMFGVFCGRMLSAARERHQVVAEMFFWGFVLLVIGWAWGQVFPINKPIWTSSYAVFMGGLAFLTLAACIWLIDLKGVTWWTKPFVIFGVNALALYVGSAMFARLLNQIPAGIGADGKPVPLKTAIYEAAFAWIAPAELASLAFALAFVAVWLGLMWLLWRKRIFIKI
jgi:predicted acyltransferase